ncbi:MAG TPA: hypothetical protein VJU77_16805 [Chthoniobacterales bacterium]|nr:hypothetical protein [Chthoniobacterales bacterium]
MKTNKLHLTGFTLSLALATALVTPCRAAELNKEALGVAKPAFSVFLIDDETGEELTTKHGIRPLAASDLEALINVVLRGSTPVRLLHQAVDEDSADNALARMDFHPYGGGQPPKAPSPGLPLRQLSEEMKTYRAVRGEWQRGIRAYRTNVVAGVERFIKGIAATQAEVSERFDRMLAERNGRDFNRSDILTCITTANRLLGSEGRRFLVLNTDAEDLPAHRQPRRTALTVQELDSQIELIFVNTSHLPDQSLLFHGLANPVHHADSMQAAMDIIVGSLNTEMAGEDSETDRVTSALPDVTPGS